jgi:hypothetical protein
VGFARRGAGVGDVVVYSFWLVSCLGCMWCVYRGLGVVEFGVVGGGCCEGGCGHSDRGLRDLLIQGMAVLRFMTDDLEGVLI